MLVVYTEWEFEHHQKQMEIHSKTISKLLLLFLTIVLQDGKQVQQYYLKDPDGLLLRLLIELSCFVQPCQQIKKHIRRRVVPAAVRYCKDQTVDHNVSGLDCAHSARKATLILLNECPADFEWPILMLQINQLGGLMRVLRIQYSYKSYQIALEVIWGIKRKSC